MSKNRTPRHDSTEGRNLIMQEAMAKIIPPAPLVLTPRIEPYWRNIINARLEWTDVDLVNAYNLATLHADVQDINNKIDFENPFYEQDIRLRDKLMARITAMSCKLQVHAAATIGEIENNKKKNAAKQQAVRQMQELDDDDGLIARPN